MNKLIRKSLIVAFDSKFGISKNNKIPWVIPIDVSFFMDTTNREHKNAIIMGRKTWESLNKPLHNRINIVISSTLNNLKDAYVKKGLLDALILCDELHVNKIFISGGSNIYKEAIENLYIDELYLTKIENDYECDNFFPIENLNLNEAVVTVTTQVQMSGDGLNWVVCEQ